MLVHHEPETLMDKGFYGCLVSIRMYHERLEIGPRGYNPGYNTEGQVRRIFPPTAKRPGLPKGLGAVATIRVSVIGMKR